MKILFVCRGNVGRSQIAEEVFNSLTTKHTSISAGTEVFENENQKIGSLESASNVLNVLREIGIEAKDNIRTQLTLQMLNEADLVVSMAEDESSPDYLLNSNNAQFWDITDPFKQSLGFTRDLRIKITKLVTKLLTRLEQ